MTFARRSSGRFSTRSLVVLAGTAVLGSLLAVTQAPAASAATSSTSGCPVPFGGAVSVNGKQVTGNPTDQGLVSLGVACDWVATVPAHIAQSSGVAYTTANGVQSVAVGDLSGNVWGFNVETGQQTLYYAAGGTRIDGPLSVSANGNTLYVPHTASKKSPN